MQCTNKTCFFLLFNFFYRVLAKWLRNVWKSLGFHDDQILEPKITYTKLSRYWTRAIEIGDGKTGKSGKGKGEKKKKNDSMKDFINDLDSPIYILKCRYI